KKLNDGDVDATLLAVAGLNRLNQLKSNMHILEIDEVLPAAGQGAVGIMCREDDYKTQEILAPLNDAKTSLCVAAERAMLDVLEGTCHTPIGALATLNGETLFLQGLIAKPDGSDLIENDHTGSADGPEQLGRELGQVLLEQAGADFMAAIRQGSE
ncbi:hydroxymethylbilane synthase, partial [bacterium]|nr:hydroxymethylbilane synthase [bacterium]